MLCMYPSTWRESYTRTHAASDCCTPQRRLDGNWALTVLCEVMDALLSEKHNSCFAVMVGVFLIWADLGLIVAAVL